ncbi:response regulator transcription factor [Nocardia sp. CA-128927]|uniref:response regulator transcription factor n=1 Tax=Nocardia sp. CA-128927 TaxID=3239975 RepID=UPI003D951694
MNDRVRTNGATVLVVDDEPSILNLLCSVLRMGGYQVRSAETGAQALTVAASENPDLIVLDVMLPDLDGFAVARRLREAGNTVPVLFLTARDATEDRIAGLLAGGDDYVAKPFSLEEVTLRIQAILRRSSAEPVDETTVSYADLELDVDAHRVSRAGRSIELSATEFSLLHYLLINAEKVVSKQQIVERVWADAEGREHRVVEGVISQLRRKIDDLDPPLIHTIRGVGYTLRLPKPQ